MKKKSTIEFVQQAKLIHGNKYDYSLVDYKNNRTKVKIICNKCGKQFEQEVGSHLKYDGCNCYKINKNAENFIAKAKLIHGNKYDYSLVDYKNNSTKVKIICPIHGVFEQTPHDHLQKKQCKRCANVTNTEDFIAKSKIIHNNQYDYSLVDYKNTRENIKIICPIHGVFEQKPYIHLQGSGCKICGDSKGEKRINTFLQNNSIIFEHPKEYEDLIDKRKLSYDFYVQKYNMLIEYNGRQHYENGFGEELHEWHKQLHHDWLKRKYAKSHNINLLVIPYWDFDNIEKILEDYLSSLE